jgi:hypothetical protein
LLWEAVNTHGWKSTFLEGLSRFNNDESLPFLKAYHQ